MFLRRFRSIRPKYDALQNESLEWFAKAHELAGHATAREDILRVGCKPNAIERRGSVLPDFLHQNWDEMDIYSLNKSKSGVGLKERMQRFALETEEVLKQFYDQATESDDLIHVSCTGYVAPSAAQLLVSSKQWKSTVTHAYHMGCYGAFPAIRMAQGFLAADPKKTRIDLVHTEICSLHANPASHKLDQLVCQTLFADGFICYEIGRSGEGLQVINILEEIIPGTEDCMRWDLTAANFEMKLAKEIPVQIARTLPHFLKRLGAEDLLQRAYFAIHPGGPRILQQIQERLGLKPEQIQASVDVLREHGNMSSATVPHIWMRLLEDGAVPDGAPIVSLAFGPGLTICGSILVKRCGGQQQSPF